MKKSILKMCSILMVSLMLFACANSAGDSSSGSGSDSGEAGSSSGSGSSGGSGNSGNSSAPTVTKQVGVQFDFANAKALAKLESKKDSNRAVSSVDDLGDLVKILEDGSMENAITVGENCSLSDIVAIYKSPLETSQDIFIVFSGESTLGYQDEKITDQWGNTYTEQRAIRVGQLICLHSDGSIADILKKENSTDYWNNHMSLNTDSVTFDAKGNLYFISRDTGDLIYQYNPSTNELTKMVAAVEGTWYDKMQIDGEGQWIFVSGSRSSAHFLRAIPINNPNSPVNIYFSSNDEIKSDKWAYDDKNGIIYFIVNDGNKEGLFTASKAKGFRDKSFYHSYVGDGFENDLFQAFHLWCPDFYWRNNFITEGEFDSSKVIDEILGKSYPYEGNYKKLTREEVDIRFDKYWTASDSLKALAVLTRGKKNEEAIEALNNTVGLRALENVSGKDIDGNDWFENVRDSGYRHNFLADILYVKGTDILLVDSDDEDKKKIFGLQSNGLFSSKDTQWLVNSDSDYNDKISTFGFSDIFYNNDKSLKSSSLKDKFFDYCNVPGSKEFRLTSFKDNLKYKELYSTLTNEDAIEWIASDPERLNLFGEYAGMSYKYNKEVGKNNIVLDYASFMKMLSTTCFISGTNEKAITWNCDESCEIPYDHWYGWYEAKISSTDSGIYYEYYNTSGTDLFYYIVQIADSNGKLVELINKLPLPAGKVVRSEKNKERVVLQYSIMNDTGSELGYHHIYAIDMETGEVTNCFDNVPNRNSLEVVSFNVADDLLYYSAVRGTAVENGIVNIVTNEYNPLSVQRKMVAVYTF